MKLSECAKLQGVSYRTVWNQFKAGKFGVPAKQLPTGTIIVDVPSKQNKVVVYARVSSHDQKADLLPQVERCVKYFKKSNIEVSDIVTEVGSGMNGKRKKLIRLLSDPYITHLVVEHRGRFMRFGSEFVEASLNSRGAKLVVVDDSELDDDLVQDIVSVLTSFCARLYDKRSAKNRAKKMMDAANAGE